MKRESSNFFTEHYDWLVAFAGFAAVAVGVAFAAISYSVSPEDGNAEYKATLSAMKPKGGAVASNDMNLYNVAVRGVKSPDTLAEVDPKQANFLASGRRVLCASGEAGKPSCGRPIPAGLTECPFCKASQPKQVKVVIDTDGDGLPNEFELANGLNPADPADAAIDSDGDGFTNLEEFLAGTAIHDKNDHPDYLDSLFIDGELSTTVLPVVFKGVQPLPGGRRRYVFRNPKARNDFGGTGLDVYAIEGEEVPGTGGFVAKAYEEKSEKRNIAGGEGMTKTVDVSECTLYREKDKRTLKVVVGQVNAPIDVEANLVYERMGERKFTVEKGSVFELNGKKYRVSGIKRDAQGGQVVVMPEPFGKERVIKSK